LPPATAAARGTGKIAEDHLAVSGIVVDVPAKGGFATIVALADGTTSMYISTGGGQLSGHLRSRLDGARIGWPR
jgi:hypothetical protein